MTVYRVLHSTMQCIQPFITSVMHEPEGQPVMIFSLFDQTAISFRYNSFTKTLDHWQKKEKNDLF